MKTYKTKSGKTYTQKQVCEAVQLQEGVLKNEMKLDESFVVDKSRPSTMLWANGSTDNRFDMDNHTFYNPFGKDNKKDVMSYLHPLFFTNNMNYVFKYVQNHISKDYSINFQPSTKNKHEKIQYEHGVVVFVKLRDGVKLFDFTDPADFKGVFGEDGELISRVFEGAEPYFAFNTAVFHGRKDDEPIENVVAKFMVQHLLSKKRKHKSNGSVMSSFFIAADNSFLKLFKDQHDKEVFSRTITHEDYNEMHDFYMKASTTGRKSGVVVKSRNGTDHIIKGSLLMKVLPESLSDKQLERVNGYFKLLKFCVEYKDLLMAACPEVQQLIDNASSKKRTGFVDLLQACLYLAIDMAGYDGFRCPEFIGQSNLRIKGFVDAVALFNKDAIAKMKGYSFGRVMGAIQYASQHGDKSPAYTVRALRGKISSHMVGLRRDRRAAQANAAQKKDEEQRRGWADAGKHLIDDQYKKDAYDMYFRMMGNHDRDKKYWNMIVQNLNNHEGKFVTMSPMSLVMKANEKMKAEIEARNKRRNPYV